MSIIVQSRTHPPVGEEVGCAHNTVAVEVGRVPAEGAVGHFGAAVHAIHPAAGGEQPDGHAAVVPRRRGGQTTGVVEGLGPVTSAMRR